MLVEGGLDTFTTETLAKRAGTSIGSVYQYFPNKLSILSELIIEWRQDIESSLSAILDELSNYPIDTKERRNTLIGEMIDRFYTQTVTTPEQLKLHAELFRATAQSPELEILEQQHNEFIAQFVVHLMKQLGSDLDDKALIDLAGYMYEAQNSVEAACKYDFSAYKRRMEWHKKASFSLLSKECFND